MSYLVAIFISVYTFKNELSTNQIILWLTLSLKPDRHLRPWIFKKWRLTSSNKTACTYIFNVSLSSRRGSMDSTAVIWAGGFLDRKRSTLHGTMRTKSGCALFIKWSVHRQILFIRTAVRRSVPVCSGGPGSPAVWFRPSRYSQFCSAVCGRLKIVPWLSARWRELRLDQHWSCVETQLVSTPWQPLTC